MLSRALCFLVLVPLLLPPGVCLCRAAEAEHPAEPCDHEHHGVPGERPCGHLPGCPAGHAVHPSAVTLARPELDRPQFVLPLPPEPPQRLVSSRPHGSPVLASPDRSGPPLYLILRALRN